MDLFEGRCSGDGAGPLYGKINRTDPSVVRALVNGSAQQLGPVMQQLGAGKAVDEHGSRVRIVDGNHLASSEKRLVDREVQSRRLVQLKYAGLRKWIFRRLELS